MKFWIVLALALSCCSIAKAAGCDLTKAEAVLIQPRPEKPDQQIDVLEQQSVEGGAWTVFNGPDGKPNRIIRTDYGEMGRSEQVLAVSGGGAFVIRETQYHYSVPMYQSGSTVVREETDYYRFCDGTLLVAPDAGSDDVYIKAARETASEFFSAPEISKVLIAAGLKPPLWK